TTTELKQLELPAISLTGPGAVTPAPSAHAMLSPAPATTGTPAGRPRRRASAGRTSPVMLHDGTTAGNEAGSRPSPASRPAAHWRPRRSSSAVAAAIDQSVVALPVSVSAT